MYYRVNDKVESIENYEHKSTGKPKKDKTFMMWVNILLVVFILFLIALLFFLNKKKLL